MENVNSQSFKNLDIEYHRTAAAEYDAGITNYYRFYHRHSLHPWAKRLASRIPNASVLDVGTGTGIVACTVAKFGCRVTGIDHSPEMLAIAKTRATDMGVSVNFALGDAEGLPYPDASFDAVTIQGVLHHLSDMMPLLRDSLRALKPGGELYISEPCIEGSTISRFLNSITSAAGKLIRKHGNFPEASDHEAPISGPKLERDLKSLGAKVKAEYLVNLGFVRFLPESFRIYPVLLFSLFTRKTNGDLLFLIATK